MLVKVEVTETLQRIVEMDVCCTVSALEGIRDKYTAECIVLDAEDFKSVDFKVVE